MAPITPHRIRADIADQFTLFTNPYRLLRAKEKPNQLMFICPYRSVPYLADKNEATPQFKRILRCFEGHSPVSVPVIFTDRKSNNLSESFHGSPVALGLWLPFHELVLIAWYPANEGTRPSQWDVISLEHMEPDMELFEEKIEIAQSHDAIFDIRNLPKRLLVNSRIRQWFQHIQQHLNKENLEEAN